MTHYRIVDGSARVLRQLTARPVHAICREASRFVPEEELRQRGRARLLERRTAIVIAHRLATIRGADRILVLRDGELVKPGTHDEHIALCGLYAQLYRLNYASFDDLASEKNAKSDQGHG